ncbi:HAD family hydrolase [Evansella sp. AB-rgal1]|uniref:HAD family hydrolase n=1 Tax=Evansella sp. AB-rgal1 TaxID=3242696 RepID=UPI00359CBBC2
MKWEGICFDLDNTLFSHEQAFKRAIEACYDLYLCKEWSVKSNVSFEYFFSVFKRNCDKYWGLYENKKLSKEEYRTIRFNETMKKLHLPCEDGAASMFHSYYDKSIDNFSEPFPSLFPLLDLLKKLKRNIAVLTNGKSTIQKNKINHLGVIPWIQRENIFISEDIGFAKPQVEIFKYAEERLNIKAAELLYIGDSWLHDVVGPMEAGWDSIFLNTRKEERKTNHQPVKEFHTLEEVRLFFANFDK